MNAFRSQQQQFHAHSILLAAMDPKKRGERVWQPLAPGDAPETSSTFTPDEKVLWEYAEAVTHTPNNLHLFIVVSKTLGIQDENTKALATEFVQAVMPPGGGEAAMDAWIQKWSVALDVPPPSTN